MPVVLEPITAGKMLSLKHRIVMGSMTRNRCIDDFGPGNSQARHYADRARYGAALIVSEGILVDWAAVEWPNVPIMVNNEHANAWRKVTDAVHQEGGKMLFQAWHPGRVQNDQAPWMVQTGTPVVAPSNIPLKGGKYRYLPGSPGHTDILHVIQDPRGILDTYRKSITLAKQAGFDGVEILAQGGYLPHQFLSSRSNVRTDAYGGRVSNRCRFLLELVDIVAETYDGPGSTCVKVCPTDVLNDSFVTLDEMRETYSYLISELVKRKVGIICICRRGAGFNDEDLLKMVNGGSGGRPAGFEIPEGYDPVLDFGPLVKFPKSPTLLMGNQGYTIEEAEKAIEQDKMDLVQLSRPFIFNPDLVQRVKDGSLFATNNRGDSVAYGPFRSTDENYNDWPVASYSRTSEASVP